MTSITETMTIQRPNIIRLTFQTSQTKSYAQLFDELFTIMEKYCHMNDYLSLDIKKWVRLFSSIEDAIEEDPRRAELNSGPLYETTVKLIHQLREEILVDPLDPKHPPLKSPYLDGNWTWEKSSLDLFKTVSKVSPYTFTELKTEEHPLAKAMIMWLNSLIEESEIRLDLVPANLENRIILPGTPNPELQTVICMSFFQLAQNSILIRANRLKAEEQENLKFKEAKIRAKIDERIAQLEEELATETAACEKKVEKTLEKLKEEVKEQAVINTSRLDSAGQTAESLRNINNLTNERLKLVEGQLATAQYSIQDLSNRLNAALDQPKKQNRFLGIF